MLSDTRRVVAYVQHLSFLVVSGSFQCVLARQVVGSISFGLPSLASRSSSPGPLGISIPVSIVHVHGSVWELFFLSFKSPPNTTVILWIRLKGAVSRAGRSSVLDNYPEQ